MAGFGRLLSRIFFWSYERGSWQYDIAVILILIFVLGTPTRWFHDQPQVGHSGDLEVYRVDARILAPPERTPALQNDLHNALQKSRADLGDGRFSIGKIEAIRDAEGNVIAYQVEIHH